MYIYALYIHISLRTNNFCRECFIINCLTPYLLSKVQIPYFRGGQSPPAAQANTEPDEKNILDEGEWGANP